MFFKQLFYILPRPIQTSYVIIRIQGSKDSSEMLILKGFKGSRVQGFQGNASFERIQGGKGLRIRVKCQRNSRSRRHRWFGSMNFIN